MNLLPSVTTFCHVIHTKFPPIIVKDLPELLFISQKSTNVAVKKYFVLLQDTDLERKDSFSENTFEYFTFSFSRFLYCVAETTCLQSSAQYVSIFKQKSLPKKTNKKPGSIVSYRVSVLEAKSTLLLSELNIAGSEQDSLFWSGMKMKL